MLRRFRQDKSGYLSEDTIAAAITALGGAVSVIRVSGPDSFQAISSFIEPEKVRSTASRKMQFTDIRSLDGTALDKGMFVKFEGPNSFTGEDVVEVHIHGSIYLASKFLKQLFELGIRQALPGEFSFRAVRNGKMSLFQAQGVADLINSSNDAALGIALEKVSGKQNERLQSLQEDLLNLSVLGEVGIDFSDQDIDELGISRLRSKTEPILALLKKLEESFERGSQVQEGIRVAFAGLPNAGKSSLFNALLGEDRSIVSEIPGTTRDVVGEKLTFQGKSGSLTFRLEDTAGIRKTEDRIEKIGVARTEESIQKADLVLLVHAANDELSEDLATIFEKAKTNQKKILGVLTKADLVIAENLERKLVDLNQKFPEIEWNLTSVLKAEGISSLTSKMVGLFEDLLGQQGEILLTRLDHLNAVCQAIEHLKRAQSVEDLDLFAADVRQALNVLSPLIGETVPDDILGKIFSQFCIGK